MQPSPTDPDVPELLRASQLTDVLVMVASILAIGLVAWLVAHILARWLTGKTRFGLRGLDRLAAPIMALGSVIAGLVLVHRTERDPPALVEILEILVSIVPFWIAARAIDVVWATAHESTRLRTRRRLASVLLAGRHLGKLVFGTAALAVVAVQLGASEQLYVILAAAAAGLAFAARDPIRSAVAFVAMALDPPFHVGDLVRISDYRSGQSSEGTVTDISLTAVTLLTRERTHVVIANIMISQLRVENLSAADRRRLELAIPVSGVRTQALRDACEALDRELRQHPGVSVERPPHVWLSGAGDGIRLKISLWLRQAADRREVQRDVLLELHDLLTV